ncbi:MAG: alpha/beta hydrolase, partial [Acidobacteriota bacterium]
MSHSSTDDLSMHLPDGRRLGYVELGDADGLPLIFFHGTPGSRKMFDADELMARIPGLRLILPERPGYGLSDPQPDRTLLDWPQDVAALADQLGLDRFAVGGISGGGPHALACAHRQSDRLTHTIVLASPAPACFPGATRGMAFGNRLAMHL